MADASAYRQHPAAICVYWLMGLALCIALMLGTPGTAHASGDGYLQENGDLMLPDSQPGLYDYRQSRLGYQDGAPTTTAFTDLEFDSDFACAADGSTRGTLFVNPQCEADGMLGVFANVVCRIENLFGTILGLVYCAVQNAILEPLLALFTLYVTIYGAMVILGMVGHTFKEAILRVMKIALVSAIALNADIAIGVGYKFYITAAQTTVGIVFDMFDAKDNSALTTMVEAGYVASPSDAAPNQLKTGSHWMEGIDATMHKILSFVIDSGVGFLMFMALLFVVATPLFFVVIYLILSILKAMVQAIIGYLLALLGITFLFMVAPLFVSFALFRVTADWFEVWLKYLASFTLQLMIVFTFLMFLLMVDLVSFFQSVGSLVRQYQLPWLLGFITRVENIYTLCRVERDGPDGYQGEIVYYKFNQHGIMSDTTGSRYEGFPKCIPEYTLQDALTGNRLPPGLTMEDVDAFRNALDVPDGITGIDEDSLELYTDIDDSAVQLVLGIVEKANHDLKLPFLELVTTADLIFFLLVRFIVVIILTYLLDRFMKKVPHLAAQLAGTGFSGRLGGGEHDFNDRQGVQPDSGALTSEGTALARFKEASLEGGGMFQRGFIRSAPRRFVQGLGAGLSTAGRNTLRDQMQQAGNLGLSNRIRSELAESEEILQDKNEGIFAYSNRRPGIGRPWGVSHPGGWEGRSRSSVQKARRQHYWGKHK